MKCLPVLPFLLALSCCVLSQDDDPFATDEEPAASQWPQRLAPTYALLRRLQEPDLTGAAPEGTVDIRFICVPDFKRPFAIRATGNADKAVLRVVRLKGKGGYDWKEIETERNVDISKEQWKALVALAAVDGAREPSQKANRELRENFIEMMSTLDGSTWFLEVRDSKGYTAEGVPNPIIGDPELVQKLKEESNLDLAPFLAVCMKLFALSGLDEKPTN